MSPVPGKTHLSSHAFSHQSETKGTTRRKFALHRSRIEKENSLEIKERRKKGKKKKYRWDQETLFTDTYIDIYRIYIDR